MPTACETRQVIVLNAICPLVVGMAGAGIVKHGIAVAVVSQTIAVSLCWLFLIPKMMGQTRLLKDVLVAVVVNSVKGMAESSWCATIKRNVRHGTADHF